MNIEQLKVMFTAAELSAAVNRGSQGAIAECQCEDGCVRIAGVRDVKKPFWAKIAIQCKDGNLVLTVIGASVDGVWFGLQEFGVSKALDEALHKHFPHAKSGGRTVTLVPLSDVRDMLAKLCGLQCVLFEKPTIALTADGIEISC